MCATSVTAKIDMVCIDVGAKCSMLCYRYSPIPSLLCQFMTTDIYSTYFISFNSLKNIPP